MKYYKSTTPKAYTFQGKLIPGNKDNGWLALDEGDAIKMEESPVIKSLLKAGGVISTTKEPAEMSRDPGQVINANAKLQVENNELRERITKLEAEAKIQLTQNEAAAALHSKTQEFDELQAQHDALSQAHAELQEKYAQLEAEAKERIAALEAQLKGEASEDA